MNPLDTYAPHDQSETAERIEGEIDSRLAALTGRDLHRSLDAPDLLADVYDEIPFQPGPARWEDLTESKRYSWNLLALALAAIGADHADIDGMIEEADK